MYIGLHVKYPLYMSHFNDTWIVSTDVLKSTDISNLTKICPMGDELLHVEGQIDRYDEFLYWYQLDTQFLYKLHKIKFLYM